MNRFQIRGLQWGAGAFLVIVGALLLIAPHQFSFVSPADYARLPVYGALALITGASLISLSVSLQPRGLALGLQLIAAALLGLIAWVFYRSGSVITAINYALLGAGLALTGLGRFIFKSRPIAASSSSLGLILAVGSILTGWLMLFRPASVTATPIFQLTGQVIPLFGSLFLAGGVWLTLVLLRLGFEPLPRHRLWVYAQRGALLFCGAVFVLFWAYTGQAVRVWVGATYFGIFGLILLFFPLIGNSPLPFEPTSLRTRLALILSLATTFPLILTIAFVSWNEEDRVRREAFRDLELHSTALDRNLVDYIGLHRSALYTLAHHPGLIQLAPGQQTLLLQSYQQAYPDALSFSLYGADGGLIASSGAAEIGPSIAGSTGFEAMQQNGEGYESVLPSAVSRTPILAFVEPVEDRQGRVVGATSFSLTPAQILELMTTGGEGTSLVYLVDRRGRVIAHPDPAFTTDTSDLSANPQVSRIINQDQNQGSFSHAPRGSEQMLVGFARVPGMDWWVIIEQRAERVFRGVYTTRDQIFGILLLFLIISVAGGFYLAGQLITPLQRLLQAVTGLAGEDVSVPLPRTEISEVQRLIDAFGSLRSRLAERTAEREQAIAALQRANEELEERVEIRTQEIQSYANRLEQSNQELEDFAFIASHDLQEPLRKIQIFGDLLQKRFGSELPPEGRDYIRRMQKASGRMRSMIEALLSYSRVSTKSRPFEPVDLNTLVAEVIDDLESSIQRNRGQIEVEELPVILADGVQIRQLFQNLIANGLKFHHDGVEPRIKITCHRAAPDRIELHVADNGIGIDMEKADYLFQLFHRLHGKTEFEGTGIGLAICRKIAERHRGSIRVESAPDAGSTFIVSLPA